MGRLAYFLGLMEALPSTSNIKPNFKKTNQQQNTLLMISDDSIDFSSFSAF